MPRQSLRLPARLPAGTKYVVERRGSVKGMMLVHRYVELPDGRQIELAARLVPGCSDVVATPVKAAPRNPSSSRPVRNRDRVLAASR